MCAISGPHTHIPPPLPPAFTLTAFKKNYVCCQFAATRTKSGITAHAPIHPQLPRNGLGRGEMHQTRPCLHRFRRVLATSSRETTAKAKAPLYFIAHWRRLAKRPLVKLKGCKPRPFLSFPLLLFVSTSLREFCQVFTTVKTSRRRAHLSASLLFRLSGQRSPHTHFFSTCAPYTYRGYLGTTPSPLLSNRLHVLYACTSPTAF